MAQEYGERRRFPRINLRCRIVIRPPNEHIILSHTENIGRGGIRVIIKEELELLSLVGLEVFIPKEKEILFSQRVDGFEDYKGEEKIIKCEGRVVWVIDKNISEKGEVIFDTGIEFYKIDKKAQEIIGKLVDSLVKINK